MTNDDCLFCKIIAGEIPSKKLFEDEDIVAIDDINPVAPVHFLIIPKEHIETIDDVEDRHQSLLGKMMFVGARLARERGISQDGYRQVINCRKQAGQLVYHIHLHVYGGQMLSKLG